MCELYLKVITVQSRLHDDISHLPEKHFREEGNIKKFNEK